MQSRFSSLLLLALISAPVCAEELKVPTVESPEGQAAIQRFLADYAMVVKDPAYFDAPATPPDWACPVAQDQQYMAAGLWGAIPEKLAAMSKQTRKHFRELGMDPDMAKGAMPKYEDIRIIPLKTACAGGKLEGDVELLVSFVSRTEFNTPVTFKERKVNNHIVNTSRQTNRVSAKFKAGELISQSRTISRMFFSTATDYDDAEYAALIKSAMSTSNKIVDEQQKHPMLTFTYPDVKTFASFSVSRQAKVSAGLFGVNAEYPLKVLSNFKVVESDGREMHYTYSDTVINQKMPMRNGKAHGDQILYMDNYLKAANMRLDQVPGMERARIVTINGVELIEKRQCYIDGVMTQTTDCPTN